MIEDERQAFPEGALKGAGSKQYFHQGLMNKEKDLRFKRLFNKGRREANVLYDKPCAFTIYVLNLVDAVTSSPPKPTSTTLQQRFLSLARSKSHSSRSRLIHFIWTDVWVGTDLP